MDPVVEQELKFSTEDDRIAAMEKYESEGGSDPSYVQKIMDAPVETIDPEPEVLDEEEIMEAPAPEESPESEQQPEQDQAPAQPISDEPIRSWIVKEEDIPKDTYFDKKEQKIRPYITQTNFGDLSKSYIHGQKRIHYLEDVLLPQERDLAAQQAKAESQAELQRLKSEIEQLRSSQLSATQQPTPGVPLTSNVPPALSQAATQPASPQTAAQIAQTQATLAEALAELSQVSPDDAIEHTDKMHKALLASMQHTAALTENMNSIKQTADSFGTKFKTLEDQRAQQERIAAESQKNNEAKQSWERACSLVDSFAANNVEFKTDHPSVDQNFADMSKEAVNFHVQLAGLMFKKHPNQVTNEEQMAASQAYLSGNEQLKQAANAYAINEPKNYKAWVDLDQVDAMRMGMYRDPITKQWVQLSDPVSRKPVHLGDMETAYGRFLDVTGKRNERLQARLKQQQTGLTGAISRRDTGIVSMDPNRLHSDPTGADMTEQQAIDTLERLDPQSAMGEYMKTGVKTTLDEINRAMTRLNMNPLQIPEIEIQKRV